MNRNKVDQIVDDYYEDAEIIDTNPESKYFGDDHNAVINARLQTCKEDINNLIGEDEWQYKI